MNNKKIEPTNDKSEEYKVEIPLKAKIGIAVFSILVGISIVTHGGLWEKYSIWKWGLCIYILIIGIAIWGGYFSAKANE